MKKLKYLNMHVLFDAIALTKIRPLINEIRIKKYKKAISIKIEFQKIIVLFA